MGLELEDFIEGNEKAYLALDKEQAQQLRQYLDNVVKEAYAMDKLFDMFLDDENNGSR